MSLYGYLTIISTILLGFTFFLGYPFCYFIVAPILFKKHGKQTYLKTYLNFYSIEKDLKELAVCVNDQAIVRTIRVINICKYSVIINMILFFVFALLSVNSVDC